MDKKGFWSEVGFMAYGRRAWGCRGNSLPLVWAFGGPSSKILSMKHGPSGSVD